MKTGKVEVYKDRKGEWRWRIKASNGRIMGDSGEGYASRKRAVNAFLRAMSILDRATWPNPHA